IRRFGLHWQSGTVNALLNPKFYASYNPRRASCPLNQQRSGGQQRSVMSANISVGDTEYY
ncbi:hypothetical protein U1Q18_051486, partial [Sarracenia purpurea var. burkii]